MKERINWIDWVKAICITGVVFMHLPQDSDTFYLRYVGAVFLTPFFFISGYLKKPTVSMKETYRKYGYSLLVPYLIYNAIYYPYWLAKFYIENGGTVDVTDCLKPIVGTVLLQLNSNISTELCGVTWFLPALFLMHCITDICNRQRHGKAVMLILSLVAVVLYGANKYYNYAPNLTYHGFIRSLCFFFMGNLFRQKGYLKHLNSWKDLTIGTVTFVLSLAVFYWHIHEDRFVLHIILYFVVCILATYGILYLCKAVNSLKSQFVTWTAIGTMVILGLHPIFTGCIDFGLEKVFQIADISYHWCETILMSLFIVALHHPIIRYARKHAPILIGKK